MGFEIDWAKDGIICVDMVEKAEDGYYDLILMDIQMPNMDGYKACQIIRSLKDYKKANLPIVAMTANAFDEDKAHALQVGMDAHIPKPFEIDELKRTISLILRKSLISKESEDLWFDEVLSSDAMTSFENKYTNSGHKCGWLIYEATGDEKIIYADKEIIEIFGCDDFDDFYKFVGGSFKTLVHQSEIREIENSINLQISESIDLIDRVKYHINRKDGEVRYLDDIGHKRFVEKGMPVFYVCLADITKSS